MSCVTGKRALRSLSLSYPKDWRAGLHQSFLTPTIKLYSAAFTVVVVIPKEGLAGRNPSFGMTTTKRYISPRHILIIAVSCWLKALENDPNPSTQLQQIVLSLDWLLCIKHQRLRITNRIKTNHATWQRHFLTLYFFFCIFFREDYNTHTLEEFKLVKMSSNVPQETRFTNKLRVSFFLYVLMIVLIKKSSKGRHVTNHSILK